MRHDAQPSAAGLQMGAALVVVAAVGVAEQDAGRQAGFAVVAAVAWDQRLMLYSGGGECALQVQGLCLLGDVDYVAHAADRMAVRAVMVSMRWPMAFKSLVARMKACCSAASSSGSEAGLGGS